MAETWNKRQRQKKKQQQKQEKAEKRLMRKENKKETSFESMIAYVDHNGNLTTKKPEPVKKEVKVDPKLLAQNELRLKNLGY